MHFDKIRKLFGLKRGDNPDCATCAIANQKQTKLNAHVYTRATTVNHRIHIDIAYTEGSENPFQLYVARNGGDDRSLNVGPHPRHIGVRPLIPPVWRTTAGGTCMQYRSAQNAALSQTASVHYPPLPFQLLIAETMKTLGLFASSLAGKAAAAVRFGVIGSNFISDRFLEAGKHVAGFELGAIYSRTHARAQSFGDKYSCTTRCEMIIS